MTCEMPQTTKTLPREEIEAVRNLLRKVLQEDFAGKQLDMAKVIHLSQGYISDICAEGSTKTFGTKVPRALKTYLGWTFDEVLRGQQDPGRQGRGRKGGDVVELFADHDERYPNRIRALRAARELGYDPKAIEYVRSIALDADEDPEPEWWLEQMRAADRKLKKGLPL